MKNLKEYEFYKEENMFIYNGDCIEVMKQLPSNSIDLCVTSPPYNLGIKYDNYHDAIGWDDYYEWCKKWLKEIYRLLKDDGRFCLNHYFSMGNSESRHSPLMDLNWISKEVGFKHHGVAVWNDITIKKRTAWGSWLSASVPYVNSPIEGILILYKNKWGKINKGTSTIEKKEFMEACSGVWNLQPEKSHSNSPAPFPISLPKRCINLLSYRNDLILDPFNGGGTTAVASKQTKRRYIGIELSEKYCKNTVKRLQQGYLDL